MIDVKEAELSGTALENTNPAIVFPTEQVSSEIDDVIATSLEKSADNGADESVTNDSNTSEEPVMEQNDLFELSEIYLSECFSCFSAKIKGASHIKDGSRCQDSFKIAMIDIMDKRSNLIVAIADGHGSKKHYLSEFGAKILTNCMCNVLQNIIHEEKGHSIDILYKRIKENLPPKLFESWSSCVLHDYNVRVDSGTESEMESEIDVLVKYGTTAMFCATSGHSLIFGKLDGNVVFFENDEFFENVVDDNLMGSEAYTMCKKENALSKWDFGISHNAEFLAISTDGLRNAFGEDDDNAPFINAIKTIYNHTIMHGTDKTLHSLPSFLRRCSDDGSADDITITCLVKNGKVGANDD
jgi:serine/threonine protein phosphatase PrpC